MENHWGKDILIDRYSTRLNPKMNELMSMDFTIRDWMDDTDCMLPRICMEYPKVSSEYTSKKRAEKRPWGKKSEPVYVDPYMDTNLLSLSSSNPYQKGVWYYTGYPLTDHHDFAGFPNIWRGV